MRCAICDYFWRMQWICHNGLFVPMEQPIFDASNRGFRYGDGLFETARFYNGNLLLASYHFDRLFSGLQLLHMMPYFTAAQLTNFIEELCKKNGCSSSARVRIGAYRVTENNAAFVIEATALAIEKTQWNESGWRVLVYPFARKSCDAFANLKSANYLPYVMAGLYAKEQDADECLVLNMHNRICDGSKTNLFLMAGGDVYTPALSEGCVAGVMRRALINFLKQSGYVVHQKEVTEKDVLQAETVFVTNAIEGMRWVRQFGERIYEYGVLKKLYNDLFATMHHQ